VIDLSLHHLNEGFRSVLHILAFVTVANFSLKILHTLPLLLDVVSLLTELFSK
jgi:hypothetical protein